MAMDWALKADEQKFVTDPVNFRNFLFFAKRNSMDLSNVLVNDKKDFMFCPKSIKLLNNAIDVSDLRSYVFNSEVDESISRTQSVSQRILSDEISRRRNAQYKSIALRALRYDHIETKALARKSTKKLKSVEKKTPIIETTSSFTLEDTFSAPKLDLSNLIISVSIYVGYTRELEYHEVRLGRLMKVTDRVELTGEHTFEDLKNSFSCPDDYAFTDDFSEKNPTIEDMSKKKYPSSMFFVHDTFFVNEHSAEATQLIQKWMKRQPNMGNTCTLPMTTRLGELNARLGQPYVFIHQGSCEHLIVFNDLSLRDESHEDVVFPRRLIERNFRRIACDCCKEHSAKWMVLESDDLLPHSPGYMCVGCYEEFCFDINGNKVAKFKAVPYCGRKEIGDGGKFIEKLRFKKPGDTDLIFID